MYVGGRATVGQVGVENVPLAEQRSIDENIILISMLSIGLSLRCSVATTPSSLQPGCAPLTPMLPLKLVATRTC